MSKEITTVGQLRKALEGVSDDVPIRTIADADAAYGRIYDVSITSFIYFKNHGSYEPIIASEYNMDKITDEEIKNKVPCVLLYSDNCYYWDFENSEYEIRNGVKSKDKK